MSNELNLSGVYMAAAQNAMAFCVTYEDWNRSLFYDTIFQPSVHIHDAALLGHPYVWTHLQEHPTSVSWLEEALRLGVLIPRLRRDAPYEEIVAEDLIRAGLNTIHPEAQKIAERLKRAEARNQLWSLTGRNFSEAFEARLRAKIGVNNPGWFDYLRDQEVAEALLRFWNDQEVILWRTEWIAEAAEASKRGGSALRASDLISLFFKKYKITAPQNPTISELLSALDLSDPIRAAKSRTFMKLVCEVYTDSFASGIGCRASIANIDALGAAIILTPTEFGRATGEGGESEEYHLGTITLPTLEEFRSAPAHCLKLIRESSEAGEFFLLLDTWLAGGDETSTSRLATALTKYATRVCEVIPRQSIREPGKVWARRGSSLLGSFAGASTLTLIMSNPMSLLSSLGSVFALVIERALEVGSRKRPRVDVRVERRLFADAVVCPGPDESVRR